MPCWYSEVTVQETSKYEAKDVLTTEVLKKLPLQVLRKSQDRKQGSSGQPRRDMMPSAGQTPAPEQAGSWEISRHLETQIQVLVY